MTTAERRELWRPSPERIEASELSRYARWLQRTRGVRAQSYAQLHAWSVEHLDEFWESIWEHFDVIGERGTGPVRTGDAILGTMWFPGARLNYAENLLRWSEQRPDDEAIIGRHETSPRTALSWAELRGRVGSLSARLRELGVRPGDTVCAVLPSIPETITALLAVAAVGAVWSVVNTDFGVQGIRDRFEQIEPTVLLTVDEVEFNGRRRDQLPLLAEIVEALPSLDHHILVDTRPGAQAPSIGVPSRPYSELVSEPQEPVFEPVEFSHPLWVLYSSGTTGRPKGIVHSHGGVVLEAHKANALQYDLRPGDRGYFAVSTTWMVWNLLVDSMMRGVTVITYDGVPTADSGQVHVRLVDEEHAAFFGTGAALLSLMERSGTSPGERFELSELRTVLSTGSPLPDSAWTWVHDRLKADVHLGSDSGGTDVASGILGSNAWDPVRVGELQAPYLGVAAVTLDPDGRRIRDEVGELVITEPMPSMPVMFWNDPEGTAYREAYFSQFDGLWRQGDWATERSEGGWQIHGRSDSTINRGGIRMGSADITYAVDAVPGVQESMVIGAELEDGGYYMPLFVVPQEGVELDDALREAIVRSIRTRVSPRYVPDAILAAPSVPTTRTGKLMEVPIKRVFQGGDPQAVNRTAAADVETLEWYVEQAARFAAERARGS